MTKFLLIRHGQPDYSFLEEKKFKGHGNDLAFLSEEGIIQAKMVSEDARLKSADILISSPYTRTMHTASIISNKLNLPIVGEINVHEWLPDLSENNRGREIIIKNYESAKEDYQNNDFLNDKEYESLYNVKIRVLNVLKKYLSYNKVILVVHEGVMHSLSRRHFRYCEILELDLSLNDIDNYINNNVY